MNRLYTIHLRPAERFPEEHVEIVREGFSLWGFLFHGLWLLYHRCWFWGGLSTLLYMLAVGGGEAIGLSMPAIMGMELFIRLMVGFDGPDLARDSLTRRGYILAEIIAAKDRKAAEYAFFQRWLKSGDGQPAALAR